MLNKNLSVVFSLSIHPPCLASIQYCSVGTIAVTREILTPSHVV